ncbi:LOG family protein [Phaeodactylibacter luteus]|uniref:Cytokinin riboside 5'-monophosphate phosphoribohydrolase n=1 Tax=Phaeodactylibacter luteus TaxID=1564516 RepID=A0A5C6RY45_9BACT|nr:TIGR00730 family Rossman fold protein [Phaeodactylibacter luteus]TXB66282.1 TIGR00730 family Rossman fold protein [Phaeodactylibacter luteus]
MQSVLIFCGANPGHNPAYAATARELGRTLAMQGKRIVYGAGKVGLMGEVAEGALEAGGEVIGIIPFFLRKAEVCHEGLSRLYVVDSMHERKIKMAQLSDAVIVLPGGYGTFDEVFEILTLAQLGQGQHPVGILNQNGFYDLLLQQLDHMEAEGFLKPEHRKLTLSAGDMTELLHLLETYQAPPKTGKWIKL